MLHIEKNIFSKVSFKTRMYNQLIKQSKSISKICRDIKESFRVQSAPKFLVDKNFK
jgi:hypothetical protein